MTPLFEPQPDLASVVGIVDRVGWYPGIGSNAGLKFRKWIATDIADELDLFAERAGRCG